MTKIKARIYLCFCIGFIFFSCRKNRDLYIFIPDGYEGTISVEYKVDSSKNELFMIGDEGVVMFFKGRDLSYYTFKNGPLANGGYRQRFFYYSESSLCELKTGPTIIDDTLKLGGISTGQTGGIKHLKFVISVFKGQQCENFSDSN